MNNFEYYKDELIKWEKEGPKCATCLARDECNRGGSCPISFAAWGLKEYIAPKPKIHTMQEISDFFGKPFAKDKNGSLFLYKEKPILSGTFWLGELSFGIPKSSVSDCESHDWIILVMPNTGDKNE
jgi:hypothetical protein